MQVYETVTVRTLELPRLRDPRVVGTVFAINRILRDFEPEVLHVQEFHPVFTGWTILSFRRHVPIVVTVHDPVPHSDVYSTDDWRWKVAQWFRRKASRLILHGPRMRAELEELDGRVAGQIDVVPHGILGREGSDDNTSGYEPGTFLFFGRIQSYKGLRYFLHAGELLHRRGHEFRLLIAGTGSDLERHRKRIACSGWVELIDRYIAADEIPQVFRRATAVVLPYTDATQSGVSAMAFAFARPVVATNVGDVPDVVMDGESGLIVPPRDGRALADAMEKLLVDRQLRDRLAAGAVQFAKEKLSWPRIAEMTSEVYSRAISSSRLDRSVGRLGPYWR